MAPGKKPAISSTWTAELFDRIDRLAPALLDLSHRIHAEPELGSAEVKASAWCADLLREHGFEVTMPVAGLDTAFRGVFCPGKPAAVGEVPATRKAPAGGGSRRSGAAAFPRPAVAFLAEYDALPGIGHACGHNIIAASALGAGIALAEVLGAATTATILVDGTPAEESTGGKIPMVAAGLYRDVDTVISMHPETYNGVGSTCLGVRRLTFSFHGRTAHAAAEPEKGINALDAAIQTFNNVNALRQHVRPDVRIHGIITNGGEATNIVPGFAQAQFSVRSADVEYHKIVIEKVRNCARAAALATGATLEITENHTYEPIRRNKALTRLTLEAMASAGLTEGKDKSADCFPASTDFGNVSQVAPAIAPMIKAAPLGVSLHHVDFATYAASPEGDAAVVAAAKVMALVGLRLVLEPETLAEVREAFR